MSEINSKILRLFMISRFSTNVIFKKLVVIQIRLCSFSKIVENRCLKENMKE